MPLGQLAQRDFPAGEFRGVAPFLIPDNGVAVARNCLLDEDGAVYKRGGSAYLSDTVFGPHASGLMTVWTGYLTPGQRTIVADPDDVYSLGPADELALAMGQGTNRPTRCTEHRGILFADNGEFMYGGSRMGASPYTTGTIAVTAGSKTVTGTGTNFTAFVDAGMLLQAVTNQRFYPVESVDSATGLTLRDEYEGTTGTGLSFTATVIADVNTPYKSGYYAVAQDKLLVGSDRFVYMSKPGKPHEFDPTDYHELPEGVRILGIEAINDRALIFTTAGLWTLTGLSYDLTDDYGNVQHRLEQQSDDLILWSREGVASWGNMLVVPCTDGVWLIDGISRPQKLTQSISRLYQSWVEDSYRTGLATVFRSHYFLPILDSGDEPVELRICRLDRPIQSRMGTIHPWTYADGYGGDARALAVRVGDTASRSPKLLATAGRSGRVATLNSFFEPAPAYAFDADTSCPVWEVQTRDYTTGELNENTVRRLRGRYEMVDPESYDPMIGAEYRTEDTGTSGGDIWGQFQWGSGQWSAGPEGGFTPLDGEAPEDNGGTPYTWHINKKGRYIRFRLFSDDPVASLILRSLELFIRPSGRP